MTLRFAYIGKDKQALSRLSLFQSPADSRFFELGEDIGRRQLQSPEKIEWLKPTDFSPRDKRPRTDLASVPPFLWSLTATYGRQTLPALFHDRDADRAHAKGRKAGWDDRRTADNEFYAGLRSNRVPVVRSWIMWAAVRGQAYWAHHRRGTLSGMVFHLLAVLTTWAAAIALLVNPNLTQVLGLQSLPGWVPLVGIVVAALTVALWTKEAPLVYVLLFTLTVMGVPLLLSLLIYIYFRAIDAIAWVFDQQKGPILWPTSETELRLAQVRAQEAAALPSVDESA